MKKLFYIHKDKDTKRIWFRWRVGKLSITRVGHQHTAKVTYPLEVSWNGVCIIRIGKYI